MKEGGRDMPDSRQKTEEFLQTLPKDQRAVYVYMRDEYERLAAAGKQTDMEEYDAYVEKKASEKFGITRQDAMNTYALTESQLRIFHNYRASDI
ncbi:hypothetical protein [Bacillus sp. FJAT-44742]|uniref:hypothetical protein n=1 Tax=Bacillus sp. FJAT-44742 TaxID=2014005 RepID=UPI000C23DB26|nr:hypothetical protein [Bacillus sp. FJAT-44742]